MWYYDPQDERIRYKGSNLSQMENLHISDTEKVMSGQHDCLSLPHMSKNMVIEITKNKMIAQFQVGYMYFTNMKLNKTFW